MLREEDPRSLGRLGSTPYGAVGGASGSGQEGGGAGGRVEICCAALATGTFGSGQSGGGAGGGPRSMSGVDFDLTMLLVARPTEENSSFMR